MTDPQNTMNGDYSEDLLCIDRHQPSGLSLFTYDKCEASDPLLVKLNRSVVKDDQSQQIICYSLPYTTEIMDLDTQVLDEIQLDDYDILPSIEGTLVRLYCANNRWILSTNRKIDAFSSYWSSRLSFGQLFINHLVRLYPGHTDHILEYFYSKLDTNSVYFFLIQSNPENRIVCNVDDPQLFFVGKYIHQNDPSVLDRSAFDNEGSIPMIAPLDLSGSEGDTTSSRIRSYILEHIHPFQAQGLLLFRKSGNEQIKIYHPEYQKFWRVRNNVPNLQMRYLQLRFSSEEDITNFFILYPKFRPVADRIEHALLEISRIIYHAYINRFIRKQYVSISKDMYNILKIAHAWHVEDRTQNKIYFNKIVALVNEQDAKLLYGIIKKYFRQQIIVSQQPRFEVQNKPILAQQSSSTVVIPNI
jgi:hypothetical protein